MFSQLSVHRGGSLPSHNAMGQADSPQKADPPDTVKAGGMHLTGMHNAYLCWVYFWNYEQPFPFLYILLIVTLS